MSAVLDYAAGPMLSGTLGGSAAVSNGSIHSGHTLRSRKSGSRPTSPSALSAKSGSTNCSTGRLSASEIKRVLDKLKGELDNERMKNKQFVKERANELKKSKLWFEREKQAAIESMAHDLKREKERSLRENDNEWRQAVKARDEEIRLLREDLKTAGSTHRDDAQSSSTNNEEFVLRLQKEIRSLRQANRDLETKFKTAARSAALAEKPLDSLSNSTNTNPLDNKLLRNVQDLVHDLDAQVNSEAFFTSGSVPELPDTLRQLREQLKRLSAIPEQLSSAERDRIRQMERALHRLRSENEELKKQRQSDEVSSTTSGATVTSTDQGAEEKIKKLKRRNAELVAIARRLEERLKSSQQQRRQASSGADASNAESVTEMRQEFERQRGRDLAEHAKAMLERDKQLENLRRRLEASNSTSNAATYEAMEAMLKTAQRERLQLERQLTWYTNKESSGGEGGLDPGSGPSAGNISGGGGGAEQLPILQEKLKIIAERLKTRDQENQVLGRQLENAVKRIEELEQTERSVAQVNQEIDRLRRELQTEKEASEKLEKEKQLIGEEKTALTVQLSDLRTRVDNFDKVNSEKQQMQASLADLRHALSEQQREQQVERNRMKAQMTEMEDLVQHLREVADRRRSLENDREEMRRQLQSKEEQISALNLNKTELCRVHEETVESLRASLREMERRCELQTLQHEEAMLELEAMRKKQHYRQQQEEQQQQLRQQQQELEEEQAQRKKEQEEEEEKRTKEAAEVEKRAKELEAQEANFVENLVTSLKSGTSTDGAKNVTGLTNGSVSQRRTPNVSENDTGQPSATPALRIFTAKYSYDPYHYSPNENPDAELSLKSGEYLIVHGTMDADGFFMGEHMDGRRGLVPSNFVEPVDMSELGPDFNLSAILGRPDGASNGSDDEKSLPTVPSSQAHDAAIKGRRSATPASPPAPCMLKVERTLSNSLVVAWQPPPGPLMAPVSAYHVYVDGQFRSAVRAASKTRALLENVDMRRMHRVSVRTVTSSGQSKDAECTLMVGDNATASPDQLKATQISANCAKLSWVPGDSKCNHTVMVNGREVKTLPPGDYKLHLNNLTPDTLHRVRVVAKLIPVSNHSGVANQLDTFAASVEFRTLPGGSIEAPIDVQVEEGPQESTVLISWLPVTLEDSGESNGVKVEGYVITVNGQKVREVSGATSDHHLLPVDCILPIIGENLNSIIQLTVRTRGTDGSESADSHPPVELSALSLGRGRTSLQVLRRSVEPQRSSPSMRHVVQVGKSPTEEFNSLESPPMPTKGVTVPKIHIIGSDLGHAPEDGVDFSGLPDAQSRSIGHGEGPRVHDRRSHRRKQQARRPDDEEAADRELEAVMSLSRQHRPPLQAGTSPTQHVERVPSPEWNRTPPTHQQVMQAMKNTRLFVALYDYDPSTMSPNQDAVDEELPFREGQLIRVYGEPDEDGFYFAETNGRRGLVPYNMISEVTEPGPDDMAPESDSNAMRLDGSNYQRHTQGRNSVDPAAMGRGRMRRMVALYDYDPHELSPNVDADDMELAFHTGDVIFVFGDMDDDGFFMGESLASGRQGLVPSNFLQELPSRSPSPLPHGNSSAFASRPSHPTDSSSHREGRRPKAAVRSGPTGPSSTVTAPAPSGTLNATNYGNVITTEGDRERKSTPSVSRKAATLTTEKESNTSSLTRFRPLKAVAKSTTNSLPLLSNGSVSSSEHDNNRELKINKDKPQKREVRLSGRRKKSDDMPVFNTVDLSSLQNPYLRQPKRQFSSDDESPRFNFSTFPKQKTSSVSSLMSTPDVTPLSTPTPSKKNSPRPSTSSQPGTPHTERKRSSVFKNPFKKKK